MLHLKSEAPLSTLESRTQRLAQPENLHAPNTYIFKYALLFLKSNLKIMQLKIRCSVGWGKPHGHTKDLCRVTSKDLEIIHEIFVTLKKPIRKTPTVEIIA